MSADSTPRRLDAFRAHHRARRLAERQRRWMLEHGETRAGYIRRYGSAADADRYGDGGEAIYAADLAKLTALKASLEEKRACACYGAVGPGFARDACPVHGTAR